MESSRVEVPTEVKAAELVPNDAGVVQRVPTDISLPARGSLDLTPSAKLPMDGATGVRQTRTSAPGVAPAPSFEASEPAGLELPLARTSAREEASAEGRQPITPTIQLSAISSPTQDFPAVLRPVVQRRADGGAPVSPSIESHQPPAVPVAPPSVPGAPTSRVQRFTDSSARGPVASRTSVSDAAMAPLVGVHPLRATAPLERSASADGPAIVEEPLHPGPLTQVPLMTMRDETSLPDPPPNGRREFQLEPLQRSGSEFGFDTPPQATELPLKAVGFLQRVRSDNPSPTTSAQGAREVSPGRLPLAPSHSIAVQRVSEDTPLSDAPSQSGTETLQAVWYENRAAASRPREGESTPVSASPAAATGPSQASESEMDELARKLYDRIRGRLKTELLVDRERAGFLTDLR